MVLSNIASVVSISDILFSSTASVVFKFNGSYSLSLVSGFHPQAETWQSPYPFFLPEGWEKLSTFGQWHFHGPKVSRPSIDTQIHVSVTEWPRTLPLPSASKIPHWLSSSFWRLAATSFNHSVTLFMHWNRRRVSLRTVFGSEEGLSPSEASVQRTIQHHMLYW